MLSDFNRKIMGDMTILLSCGCLCLQILLNYSHYGYFDRDKNELSSGFRGHTIKESHVLFNGNFRILKWRYLPYIRPT